MTGCSGEWALESSSGSREEEGEGRALGKPGGHHGAGVRKSTASDTPGDRKPPAEHGTSLTLPRPGRVTQGRQSKKATIESGSFRRTHTRPGDCVSPVRHVTLTSRTWSSLLGMTRTCVPALELKAWPGGSARSRGMGRPLCSLLAAECTLPLLLTLPLSSWSSTCLSTDRLSFSIQLSAKPTVSETEAALQWPLPTPGSYPPPKLPFKAPGCQKPPRLW